MIRFDSAEIHARLRALLGTHKYELLDIHLASVIAIASSPAGGVSEAHLYLGVKPWPGSRVVTLNAFDPELTTDSWAVVATYTLDGGRPQSYAFKLGEIK